LIFADIFHFDENFEAHQQEYEAIRREILGDNSDSESGEENGADEDEENEEQQSDAGISFLSLLQYLSSRTRTIFNASLFSRKSQNR
jgi:hypothetical protein